MNSLRPFLLIAGFFLLSSSIFANQAPDISNGLSLRVSPNPGIEDGYPRSDRGSGGFAVLAIFSIWLKNNAQPLAHHPISISVEGPQSWTEIVNTESDGFYPYMIDISQHTTVGIYKMTISSTYGDEKVSQEVTFRVKEYLWDD